MHVVTKDIERPLPIVVFLEVRIDASLSFLAVSEEDLLFARSICGLTKMFK